MMIDASRRLVLELTEKALYVPKGSYSYSCSYSYSYASSDFRRGRAATKNGAQFEDHETDEENEYDEQYE
jgi:hypothetical protein